MLRSRIAAFPFYQRFVQRFASFHSKAACTVRLADEWSRHSALIGTLIEHSSRHFNFFLKHGSDCTLFQCGDNCYHRIILNSTSGTAIRCAFGIAPCGWRTARSRFFLLCCRSSTRSAATNTALPCHSFASFCQTNKTESSYKKV